MKKKCLIIGSGLGGLSCGYILAKNGYEITILEKNNQIGGCLQCFTRQGVKFETGMHFIGSADKGQASIIFITLFGYRQRYTT
jgi:all-trans-retinol 13,14-reductase